MDIVHHHYGHTVAVEVLQSSDNFPVQPFLLQHKIGPVKAEPVKGCYEVSVQNATISFAPIVMPSCMRLFTIAQGAVRDTAA